MAEPATICQAWRDTARRACRHEPPAGVGGTFVRGRTGLLDGDDAAHAATERGLGFLIGVCVVGGVGALIAYALLVAGGW
ncbi:MAG TPA: hypothetical protein VEA44_16100 [Caulobacter sp.]|nr:hypothetical protein [Caulobacter sp.]